MDVKGWLLPDTDPEGFRDWMEKFYDEEDEGEKEGEETTKLFPQQKFVRRYLADETPYRGLLLYHGLGSGKSCSAIVTAEALRDASSARGVEKKVFVLLPASLKGSYVREVRMCGGPSYREDRPWSWDENARRWVPGTGKQYDLLPSASKTEIRKQIDADVDRTHRFVHYNGLNPSSLRDLLGPDGSPNPFDDSVVVVDEAHNLVSNLSGGKLAGKLYDAVYAARRCKVILLSGTPLVNSPVELSYLANLVSGPIERHETVLEKGGLDPGQKRALDAHPDVVSWSVESRVAGGSAKRVLVVRLAPDGFVTAGKGRVIAGSFGSTGFEGSSGSKRERAIDSVSRAVFGSPPKSFSVRRTELLPSDPDMFAERFIDSENDELLPGADKELGDRLTGLVSYFEDQDPEIYPELRSVRLVLVPLSPRQFSEYTTVRVMERTREEKAKRFAAMRGDASAASGGVGMRPFSRSACTFVFPEGIVRPRMDPKMMASVDVDGTADDSETTHDSETDTGTDRKTGTGKEKGKGKDKEKGGYSEALDAAIARLGDLPPHVLLASSSSYASSSSSASPQSAEGVETRGLAQLSPKFDAIVRHLGEIAGKGTALVYSQFRRAEGVAILAVVLEANGYVELAIERDHATRGLTCYLKLRGERVSGAEYVGRPRYVMYSNDDREVSEAVKDVFNNRATSSSQDSVVRSLASLSPDGKTTSNLRGESVRAMLITRSGAEGINTRNVRQVHVVEPFWHANRIIQVIGRARRANSHTDLPPEDRNVDVYVYAAKFTEGQAKLHEKDKGMTSDEYVHEVAQKKRKLLASLLDTLNI
jgi:hypothetical protein